MQGIVMQEGYEKGHLLTSLADFQQAKNPAPTVFPWAFLFSLSSYQIPTSTVAPGGLI